MSACTTSMEEGKEQIKLLNNANNNNNDNNNSNSCQSLVTMTASQRCCLGQAGIVE